MFSGHAMTNRQESRFAQPEAARWASHRDMVSESIPECSFPGRRYRRPASATPARPCGLSLSVKVPKFLALFWPQQLPSLCSFD